MLFRSHPRRRHWNSKVSSRVAIELAGLSRELAVPEVWAIIEPSPCIVESRRQMAMRYRASACTANDDASNFIMNRWRALFHGRLRLSIYERRPTCQEDKNKSEERSSSHGVTSATGTAFRFSVGLSPALIVTACRWVENGARLAASRKLTEWRCSNPTA